MLRKLLWYVVESNKPAKIRQMATSCETLSTLKPTWSLPIGLLCECDTTLQVRDIGP